MTDRPATDDRASTPPSRSRLAWADWARVLGACAVVLIHVLVSTRLAFDAMGGIGVVRTVAYGLTEAVLLRWAVPAFMMLTGYLMLDPSRPAGPRDMLRRAGRLAAVLVLFGTIFAAMEEAWGDLSTGAGVAWASLVPRAVTDVLTMRSWDHLWYLYATIATYLVVPLLRRARASLGAGGFRILTGVLVTVVLVVPTAASLGISLSTGVVADVLPTGDLPPAKFLRDCAVGVALACVGGCLRDRWPQRGLAIAGALSTGLTVVLWLVAWEAGLGGAGSILFLHWSPLPAASALGALSGLRLVTDDADGEPAWVSSLARDSLGIYVIHPLFIHLVLLVASPDLLPPPVFEAGLFAMALVASVAATRMFRKAPHLGRLL